MQNLKSSIPDTVTFMEMYAAEITQTGRAYLQVGNNEVYELFQAAWSGADYQPDKDELGIEDHTIYLINDLGQYEVLNQDLSGLDLAEDIKEVPTELEAIVSQIQLLTESQQIAPVPQPWLPPLPDKIVLDELYKNQPHWQERKLPLEVILGKVDLPSKQLQQIATHIYPVDGHLAVFSSPGMGKTTLLQSVGLDLARRNTPEQLHIYLLDFGTNGLLPLLALPQVADIIYPDDEEKIPKFVTRISEEIRRRKTLFADYRVASLENFEKASGDTLPSIMFIIDSYEGLKGSKYEDLLEKMITTISRDGAGLGMYLTLSTRRLGTLKAALHTNIRAKITFKQTDETEAKGIVGKYTVPMEEKVGRGMLKHEDPEVFQASIPVNGQDAFDINENLKEIVKQLDVSWTGLRPDRIPVVPDILTVENFLEMPDIKTSIQNMELPIGLEFEEVKAISVSINHLKPFLVLSDKDTVRLFATTHILQMVIHSIEKERITLFDSTNEFINFSMDVGRYINLEQGLTKEAFELKNAILQARKKRNQLNKFVIITDLQTFLSESQLSDNDFAMMYEESQKVGVHFIFSAHKNFFMASTTISKYIKERVDIGIIAQKMGDQTVFTRSSFAREENFNIDEVYFHYKDIQTKIKITK
ncbi:hypothetical protein DHL47_09980 [Streptococcus panodentis]|uniref:FtsK domain-containing protein n=1 Tax=Streptococcus panodentis TaxID=1581472 RepID=A0ABS5AYY1_9STRE|nr:FtsK/SpoIIIE domain-containing protein [Streptococcus panodentis]MBP2621636.1 hypothetical protein [Streptococcus panodentis]